MSETSLDDMIRSPMTGGPEKDRGHWAGRIGFILAAAGSAIGLGNIWKFPYITGEYGGGAFVLVYLGCVLIVGLPLMLAEVTIGRASERSPVGAFTRLHRPGSPWGLAGALGVLSAFLILAFYSVVAGWAMAYVFKSAAGFTGAPEAIQDRFTALVMSPGQSILWHTLFMLMTILIVCGGVRKGIERWSRILMPGLFLILIGLLAYGLLATGGGRQALEFLFRPNFHKLSAEAALSALGHAFFTLSLGMGAMITYGSYLRRDQSIVRGAIAVSFLDTLIALMAGAAIFSLVFNYNMEPGQGVGLIFKTLPVLFAQTGPWVAVPFFLLLTFAALTSAISLLEVAVSYLIDSRGWSRTKATLLVGSVIYAVGIPCAVTAWTFPFRGQEQGLLDILDFVTTNYMLPTGGLLICLFTAWVMKRARIAEELGSDRFMTRSLIFTLRYITPIAVLAVLLHGLHLLPFMTYK